MVRYMAQSRRASRPQASSDGHAAKLKAGFLRPRQLSVWETAGTGCCQEALFCEALSHLSHPAITVLSEPQLRRA